MWGLSKTEADRLRFLQLELNKRRMKQMDDLDFLEKVRKFSEVGDQLTKCNSDLVQWVMRIGQSRNILNNALREFAITSELMRELERNIPQFHKQPGLFRELQERIDSLTSTLQAVHRELSYVKKKEEPKTKCDCEDREDSDREYEDEDEDEY
jgi:hypothetical protein